MSVMRAVLYDLAEFAFSALFPVRAKESRTQPLAISHAVLPVEEHSDDLVVTKESTFKTVAEVVADRLPLVPLPKMVEVGTVVVSREKTPLFLHPTKEFDGVIGELTPGKILRIDAIEGNWILVAFESKKGWILRESVHDQEALVHPYFVINEYCAPESENTKRLRAIINDEFSGALAESPLMGEEYVTYQLMKRDLALPMVTDRPRAAGNWHRLFKGLSGVHVSVRPKTGSVMEWLHEDQCGRIAYVNSVLPDESLTMSMVGDPEDGYYSEKTFDQDAWQALSPVFIQFS